VSATPKEAKVEKIGEIKGALEGATGFVLTDYRGLKVGELQELRRRLRPRGIEYRVVKNTLFAIAATEQGTPEVKTLFSGPTAIALTRSDEVELARGIIEEARTLKGLRIYGGVLRGQVVGAEDISALAALPGRAQLQATIVGVLEAPLSQLVATLAAPLRELVATIQARGSQA
jgi:large subunit ribosomal protein L10